MSGSGGFQEKALQNRAAIAHISPTSNERMAVRTKTLDGRAIATPPHQVAVLSEQPKVVYVNPQTAVPSAWQGAETFIDFQIPPELHVLTDLVLRLPITVGAIPQGGVMTRAPATSWWVSRIEVQAGKDTVETIYPEQLYFQNVSIQPPSQTQVDAEDQNYVDPTSAIIQNVASSQAAVLAATYIGEVIPAGSYTTEGDFSPYHLPIRCSLTQGKVFVSGFVTPFRLRVFFPAQIATASAVTMAQPQLTNGIQLYCYEQELSAINFEAQLRAHRNGAVSYKCVIFDRYTEAYPNMTSNTTQPVQLKAFKSLSAGLLLFLQPAPADVYDFNAKTWSRGRVASLELRDNVGRRMTETLPDDWLRSHVWKKNFDSVFCKFQPTYIIPFSSDLSETVKNGVNLGYEQLTTLEQLNVITSSSLGNNGGAGWILNLTSINYAMLECQSGVPRVVFT